MKILLTGSTGQVGWQLARALPALGTTTEIIAPARRELDLTDSDALRRFVRATEPELIINAACFTAVDETETSPERATTVNGRAPGLLAELAATHGTALIHFSTDYVFDGRKRTPYEPEDEPNPINAYGRSKLLGEQAVRDAGGESLILRLSWVYGLRRRNFLRTMLQLASERDHLRVVDDQIGCPTPAHLVAKWTTQIIQSALAGAPGCRTFDGRAGTYHLACAGQTSWYGFAQRIFELTGLDRKVTVEPIATSDYPTPAQRPKYSCLNCQRTVRSFSVELPHWDDALQQVISEYQQTRPSAASTTAQGT